MIKLTENEIGRLKNLSYDIITMEALKKLFLNVYLDEKWRTSNSDVQVLAASRLAIDFLDEGFKELERYKKVEIKKQNNNENPVL